jgi:hypothetical protein
MPRLAEVHGGGPGAGERPAQVGLDDEVEVVIRHLPRHPVAQHARVGDHGVETAELAHRGGDELLGRLRRTDRSDHHSGPAPRLRHEARGLVRRLGVHIVHDDGRTRGREGQRVGAAEAAPAAGDDDDPAAEVDPAHR